MKPVRMQYPKGTDPFEIKIEGGSLSAKFKNEPVAPFHVFGWCESSWIPPVQDPNFPIFRMGWDTIMVFEKQHAGYQPTSMFNLPDQSGDYPDFVGKTFVQVTTQMADTCTVIYMETEEQCLFAHFNVPRTEAACRYITYIKKKWGDKKVKFFCSYVETLYEEQDNTVKNALEDIINGFSSNQILFNRSAGYDEPIHLSHMEFGFYAAPQGTETFLTKFFGDVCKNPCGIEESIPYTSFCYNDYDGLKGLQNLFHESP